MSESLDLHRTKALELAVQAGGTHTEVIARAHAFHEFLAKGTGKPNGAAAAQAPASTTKAAAAAPGKPAAAPKATPATGTKPAAAAKPGAAAPKAAAAAPKAAAAAPKAAAAGARPKGDTKDPNGNNTYEDVVAALQRVMRSVPGDSDKREKGRKLAYEILATNGNGVKNVSDLKPALYDTVVAACEKAAKSGVAPKAATVVEDKSGKIVDTSGANAETAGEDDPPEGGAGDGEAEDI